MAFGKKKTLRVEFFDKKADRIIGFDELSLKEIPEDFQNDTWVEIDGDRWKVVEVEPVNPKKALKSGTLVVHVELVERRTPVKEEAPVVEVKETPVFQQPSRADQMPRMSGKREDLRLLEIGTWEWRDREFTIASNRSTVKEVFGKISELEMLNSTVRDGKTFYSRQYERYDLFAPLRGSKVMLETIVTEYFPSARAIDGLTFMGSDQVADSTFVFQVASGIVFYGQEFDEVVRYLAVHRPVEMKAEQLRADSETLATFMRKKGLILVDWPKRVIVEAEAGAVLDYFLAGFADEAVTTAREFFAKHPPVVAPAIEEKHEPRISLEKPANEEVAKVDVPVVIPAVVEVTALETTSEAVPETELPMVPEAIVVVVSESVVLETTVDETESVVVETTVVETESVVLETTVVETESVVLETIVPASEKEASALEVPATPVTPLDFAFESAESEADATVTEGEIETKSEEVVADPVVISMSPLTESEDSDGELDAKADEIVAEDGTGLEFQFSGPEPAGDGSGSLPSVEGKEEGKDLDIPQ
jgi:hypothetical protein